MSVNVNFVRDLIYFMSLFKVSVREVTALSIGTVFPLSAGPQISAAPLGTLIEICASL